MAIRHWIFGAALLASSQASAHTHLASSLPADGGVLAAGAKELMLAFDGLIATATCTVSNAAQQAVAGIGAARLAREKVHVPIAAALTPGAYALACSYKGVDGHEMNATVKFTVAK